MNIVIKKYKKFAIYSAPSNYLYNASNQLPIIFLSGVFGIAAAGFFGIANSIIKLPLKLISKSVAQVFYAEAASIGKKNPEKIKKIAINLMKKLSLLAVIPTFVLLLFAPTLFSFVFGPEWEEAGIYASLLSISLFFNFIVTPLGRILEIFQKQNIGFLFNVIRLIIVLFIFGFAILFDLTIISTVGIYSIAMSLIYISMFIFVVKVLNIEIIKTKRMDETIK